MRTFMRSPQRRYDQPLIYLYTETNDERQTGTMSSLGHAIVNGNGRLQVGNNYTAVHNYNDPSHNRCLADLRLTDPRDDKLRIEQTKGGLLRDSYEWILDHEAFRRWRGNSGSRLLWIKGDAGKGKTMLLCGIIDELSQLFATHSNPMSFFFCQGTEPQLNHAVAVLRGLTYLLIRQQPSLIRHIQELYDNAGRRAFEDANAFFTLCRALTDMLGDPDAKNCYMIIDALDECETGLPRLLDFIVKSISAFPRVKWIVSSRYKHEIEQQIHRATSTARLTLELNERQVDQAIHAYIDYQVMQLASLKNHEPLQEQVREELRQKADGTFLWVSLVVQKLQNTKPWDILSALKQIPAGLWPLYQQMMKQIQQQEPQDSELCRLMISTVTAAYRPLHLCELAVVSGIPEAILSNLQYVEKVVDMCGSFLTVRGNYVYLIHQSAKDFLIGDASTAVFKHGFAATHYAIFLKSMHIMSKTLRRDMYNLHHPGILVNSITQPESNPLAPVRYSCIYWVDHLSDAIPPRTSTSIDNVYDDLYDGGTVYQFLSKKYLYWLEALSLLHSMSDGVVAIRKLEALAEPLKKGQLSGLMRDALRFILSHKGVIEIAPLQVYISALLFSPTSSLVRCLFKEEEPTWVISKLPIEADWNACLETLEGHSCWVTSVVFSADGQRLASASDDKTIRIWDTAIGACIQTLEDHTHFVTSVAFSADSQRLASGSLDGTVKTWDTATGACLRTLKCHDKKVKSIIFLADGQRLASASDDNTVRIWDMATGNCLRTLEGHGSSVASVAFSTDGQRFVSGSRDGTVKIWDTAIGACIQTLEDHTHFVTSVAFSADSQRLASGSRDGTVKIWDTATGACLRTLKCHDELVMSVIFLADGQRLASASDDNTVWIWDIATGNCLQTLEGHNDSVNSIASPADGQRLASGSNDDTIRIWDVTIGACSRTLKDHNGSVNSVIFSADGQRLASSDDNTVKIWDTATGACLQTLGGYYSWISSVVFSADSQKLAFASDDRIIEIWDAATGNCLQILEGHGSSVTSVAFSTDSQQLASGSRDGTVKTWDTDTGACLRTLKDHNGLVNSVIFSADGQRLASSDDNTAKIWDTATGDCLQTLEGHMYEVISVIFSADSQRLASGSGDYTVRIWNVTTGDCLKILVGHDGPVMSVVFSADGQRLASSDDNTIRIWDAATGACLQMINISKEMSNLWFDPMTHSRLYTDLGALNVDLSGTDTPTEASLRGVSYCGYGISTNSRWIVKDDKPLLWLPPEYRPRVSAVAGSTVCIGCSSGRVLLMQFSATGPGS